jgi:hypothetical protein
MVPPNLQVQVAMAVVAMTPEGERVSDEAVRLLRSFPFETLDLSFHRLSIFALLTPRSARFSCAQSGVGKSVAAATTTTAPRSLPSARVGSGATSATAAKTGREAAAAATTTAAAASASVSIAAQSAAPVPPATPLTGAVITGEYESRQLDACGDGDVDGTARSGVADSWEDDVDSDHDDGDGGTTNGGRGGGRRGGLHSAQCRLHGFELNRLDTLDLSFCVLDGAKGPDMIALMSSVLPQLRALMLAGCLGGTVRAVHTFANSACVHPCARAHTHTHTHPHPRPHTHSHAVALVLIDTYAFSNAGARPRHNGCDCATAAFVDGAGCVSQRVACTV